MKVISPAPVRRQGWAMGIAAVCLMLVLSVGGTMLFLHSTDAAINRPVETRFPPAEQETAAATPEDQYAQVTNRSVEEVEAFAKVVRYNMLEMNWAALEEKILFPLQVQDMTLQTMQEFIEWIDPFFPYSRSRSLLEGESCETMFCNWQGICMAEGFIWLNEVGNDLKITAINVEIQPVTVTDTVVKQVPEVFADVLAGKEVHFYGGNYGPRTLEEYCTGLWGSVTVDRFAVVDMDGDGICEVIVSVQTEEEGSRSHLVLRQDGKYVCGYAFRPGEMLDLKKDGSFFSRDRDHHLYFNDAESLVTVEVQEQAEKPLAQWHAFPCMQPKLVLRSYEYVTGTGQSRFLGSPYSYFESIVQGRAGNDLQVFTYWGMETVVYEEDQFFVFDPDAPGTAVYGTIHEENGYQQFSQLGFYVAAEEKEYMAEVRNMLSEEPEYWVDAHLPFNMGTFGRMVSIPEELIAYFGFTPIPDEQTLQDQQAIRTLIDGFAAVCLTEDPKAMAPYLAENAQGQVSGLPKDGTLELLNYGYLPDQTMGEWGRYVLYPMAQVAGLEGQLSLHLELVKQPDGWKVLSYRVER